MTVPPGPDQPQRGYGSRPAPQQPGPGPQGPPPPPQHQQQPGFQGPPPPQQQPGHHLSPQPGYPGPAPQGPPPGQPGYSPGPSAPPPPQYQYPGPPPPQQQVPPFSTGYPQFAGPYGRPPLPPQATRFNPAMLLPIQHWLRDRSLRNWITILFVALVVVPSVALVYVGNDTSKISESTWAFAIYFACAWLLVLWIAIRPPMVRPLMLLEVGIIGLVFETPLALWLEKKFDTPNQDLWTFIFTVGVPEEFCKMLPVLVLGLLLKQVWGPLTPKDYLFLGAVSGLAFGAAEAVQYINVYLPAQAGSIAVQAQQGGYDPGQAGQLIANISIQNGSWRFVTDPMSHAVWAGITGYFIGLGFRHPRYFWLPLVGLGLTSVLHGINDDVAGHWFWIVEIIVSVLLFMAYVQAGGVIEQQLTEVDEAHARAHPVAPGYPAGPYAYPVPPGVPAPGAPPPPPVGGYPAPAPGWAPTGYGTGSLPVAPSWNPAAGWGQSGFTPIRGYRPPSSGSMPQLPPPPAQG